MAVQGLFDPEFSQSVAVSADARFGDKQKGVASVQPSSCALKSAVELGRAASVSPRPRLRSQGARSMHCLTRILTFGDHLGRRSLRRRADGCREGSTTLLGLEKRR